MSARPEREGLYQPTQAFPTCSSSRAPVPYHLIHEKVDANDDKSRNIPRRKTEIACVPQSQTPSCCQIQTAIESKQFAVSSNQLCMPTFCLEIFSTQQARIPDCSVYKTLSRPDLPMSSALNKQVEPCSVEVFSTQSSVENRTPKLQNS